MTDRLRTRRLVAGVLAWALFAVAWSVALSRGVEGATRGAAVLLLAAVAALVLTLAWQGHNRSIYRRRGPRRTAVLETRAWEQDRLGHRLHFGDGLATAAEVVVGLSAAGVKTYRAER